MSESRILSRVACPKCPELIKDVDELRKEVEEYREALEFECGNNCHPEHNPCNAREVLARFPR